MNYIKLLNAAFEKFYFDDRLNPTHISLYMALFQEWNSCRFMDEFYVNRRDLMRCAKIGSKSTYHRCIVELDSWQYLSYFPSNNPYKGSKIKMAIIGTSDEPLVGQYNPILEQLAEQYLPRGVPLKGHHHPKNGQVVNQHRPIDGQALVSNTNNIKQENYIKQPKGRQAVILFFEEKITIFPRVFSTRWTKTNLEKKIAGIFMIFYKKFPIFFMTFLHFFNYSKSL